MHIQIVNFNLKDLSQADYEKACDEQFAPAFSNIQGLVAKIWLSDPATNTYGGVYAWEDRAAMLRYQETDLFKAVISHPNLANLTSRDYAVMEGPSRVTNGLLAEAVRA